MIRQLEAYLNSDQAVVDEFKDTTVEKLVELKRINKLCLEAMETMAEDQYWQWRADQPWSAGYIPSYRPSIDKVKAVCEKMIRCIELSLSSR